MRVYGGAADGPAGVPSRGRHPPRWPSRPRSSCLSRGAHGRHHHRAAPGQALCRAAPAARDREVVAGILLGPLAARPDSPGDPAPAVAPLPEPDLRSSAVTSTCSGRTGPSCQPAHTPRACHGGHLPFEHPRALPSGHSWLGPVSAASDRSVPSPALRCSWAWPCRSPPSPCWRGC